MTYGTGAIKFVMVANGGAILSILTFIGNYPNKIPGLKYPIIFFVAGVIVSGVANITAYLTQFSLFNQREGNVSLWRDHRSYLYISMLLVLFGMIFFSIGSLEAACALP